MATDCVLGVEWPGHVIHNPGNSSKELVLAQRHGANGGGYAECMARLVSALFNRCSAVQH